MRISRNGARIEPPTPEEPKQKPVKPAARQAAPASGEQAQAPAKPRTAPKEKASPPSAAKRGQAYDFEKDEELAAQLGLDAPRRGRAYDAYEEEEEGEEETPRRRFPFGPVIVLLMLALIGFGAFKVYGFYNELSGLSERGQEQEFVVEQGSSVAAIASQLKEEGVIEYDWLFKLYAKYSGKASGMQYGTFAVRRGMSYNEIIKTLSVQQRRATTRVTFPEGSTAVAIAQAMEAAGLCTVDEFLSCANGWDGSDFSQYDFWNQIPDNGRIMKCEGYLLPETYEFFVEDEVYNYVDTFYKEFDKETQGLLETVHAKGTTLDNVIILASFIQEEAGMASEDAKVSACFHNRLESDDPLWADHRLQSNACSYFTYDTENNYLWNSPTAEYMGWVAAGAIPEEILNLYDTYRISGLPAGPISNPGYAAIEAALNPDETFIEEGYYFFVTGHPDTDVAGQYFYAKTANEHEANVERAGWAY